MWKNLSGYVILNVQGLGLARFLRSLLFSNIPVFDISHIDETTARLSVRAKDFHRLLPIRRRERCKIRILEKHGLPFLIQTLMRRPVLLYGIPVAWAILFLLCSRIWMIQITGTERTDPDTVMELLHEHGIAVGKVPRGNVLILAADDISARLPDAAWVSLNRDGVLLRVQVTESIPQSETPDTSVPADLVAKKDAIILSVQTKRGKCQIKPGQIVSQGTVLISGHVMYSPDKTTYDTRADGIVLGSCTYSATADLPETVAEHTLSGNTETLRTISVCGFPLWQQKTTFAGFMTDEEQSKAVSLFGLPIAIRTQTCSEVIERERRLAESERQEQAELYALTDAMALVPHDAKICGYQTVLQKKGDRTFVQCTVVTEENIAQIKEYGPHE